MTVSTEVNEVVLTATAKLHTQNSMSAASVSFSALTETAESTRHSSVCVSLEREEAGIY